MNALEKLGTARLIVRQTAPYLRAAVLSLVPREAPGLGTIGVTADMVLSYDPLALDAWTAEETAGALVHEIAHCLHKHHARRGTRDPKTWNEGADLSINHEVQEMGFKLPKGCLMPDQFGFKRNLTADEYHDLLSKQQQQAPQQGQQPQQGGQGSGQDKDQGQGQQDGQQGQQDGSDKGQKGKPQDGKGQGQQGNGKGRPQVGKGWCGGCAGHPQPDEPAKGSEDGRSEGELERVRKQVAEAIQEASAKGRGTAPAGWQRWADQTLEPPKVRWQNKLAVLCRAALAYRPGAVDHTYSRISRRQGGLGFGPGVPVVAALHAPVPRVRLIVDTSASMGSKELGVALREARGILAAVGADITFMVCDARVHGKTAKIKDWKQIPQLLKGGGGTDFRPAFREIEQERQKPDVVVFITDGDGTAPALPPAGVKVIWLLVGRYHRRPCAWGEAVEVDA